MDKRLKQKILRWTYITLGSIFVILSSYGAGTFFPNPFVTDKIIKKKEISLLQEWKSYGFFQPSIEYSNNTEFILAVGKCIAFHNLQLDIESRVHRDIIVAMAVLETGYGQSRFAHEANNLFGIRTWDKDRPHVKPLNYATTKWAVKKYNTKCDSVKDMMRILNNLHFYEKFREARLNFLNNVGYSLYDMVATLSPWSTNPRYTELVNNRVKHIQIAFTD